MKLTTGSPLSAKSRSSPRLTVVFPALFHEAEIISLGIEIKAKSATPYRIYSLGQYHPNAYTAPD
ncbi:hypothetical protein [Chlorobaculum sp. 24CR]|uniref:hypothetical protein n=1 Tax=Chlorobaculum sp. 24CR TaxID=2508878 RepID=UPI00352BB03A